MLVADLTYFEFIVRIHVDYVGLESTTVCLCAIWWWAVGRNDGAGG